MAVNRVMCPLPSLVPRPLLFFVLWFVFSIMHGSRRAVKNGEAWEQGYPLPIAVNAH